jgi:hypothetical protein
MLQSVRSLTGRQTRAKARATAYSDSGAVLVDQPAERLEGAAHLFGLREASFERQTGQLRGGVERVGYLAPVAP